MGNPMDEKSPAGPGDSADSKAMPAPPPYSEPEPATAAAGASSSHHIARQFPPAFGMYKASSFSQRHYAIGEHQANPLYHVSIHSGWSGQADVILHAGASESAPPLASVDGSAFSRKHSITLPAAPAAGAATQTLSSSMGWPHSTYSFAIETGHGAAAPVERFEWRHSSDDAIKGMGGRGSGWKLVRLSTGAPAGMGHDAQFVGGGPRTSDGKEVVAVYSWASMSMTKAMYFQFLGSGASGGLGERWAIMAVITALAIWNKERKARNSAAASSGAAGGGGGG
ncbi:hypothetical protein F5Y15DRAFT_184652 [Xylariaceae sp. FL0016]|nr:hypothetical protein F5Y15DRAFT_184652 [Xylariaceae sp. FL0016]